MRKAAILSAALLGVCLMFSLGSLFAQRTVAGSGDGGTASAVTVAVSNFPQVQPVQVEKTVTVTGSVAVTNLPAVQQVGGAVSVSNLPVDGQGNLRVTNPSSSAGIHFAGYTVAVFREGTGLLALSRACQAEFPATRVCNGFELVNMIPAPPVIVPDQGNDPSLPGYAFLVAFDQTNSNPSIRIPFSSCMSASGVPFDCGGLSMVVACCGY